MKNQLDLLHEAIGAYLQYRINQGNPIENEVNRFAVQADRDSVEILSGPNDGDLSVVAIYRDRRIEEVDRE